VKHEEPGRVSRRLAHTGTGLADHTDLAAYARPCRSAAAAYPGIGHRFGLVRVLPSLSRTAPAIARTITIDELSSEITAPPSGGQSQTEELRKAILEATQAESARFSGSSTGRSAPSGGHVQIDEIETAVDAGPSASPAASESSSRPAQQGGGIAIEDMQTEVTDGAAGTGTQSQEQAAISMQQLENEILAGGNPY
jgi:hypothetical protein